MPNPARMDVFSFGGISNTDARRKVRFLRCGLVEGETSAPERWLRRFNDCSFSLAGTDVNSYRSPRLTSKLRRNTVVVIAE